MKLFKSILCFSLLLIFNCDSLVKIDSKSINPSIYLSKIKESLYQSSEFVTQNIINEEVNSSTNKYLTIINMIDSDIYKYAYFNISNVTMNNITLGSSEISISNYTRSLRSLQKLIGCNSISANLNVSFIKRTFPNITYFINYYGLGIGLNENHLGIKVIFYENNSFSSLDLDDFLGLNLTRESNFSKPLLIQNFNIINSSFFAIQEKNLFHLYIFNLSVNNNQYQIDFHAVINGSILNNSIVLDLQVYNNNWVVSVLKEGILFLDSSLKIKYKLNTYHKNLDGSVHNTLKANSLLIIKEALYVSIDNFGLKIYSLTSLFIHSNVIDTNFELIHPGIKKLEYVLNNNTNKLYLGISLKPNLTYKEFFIELIVNNNFEPEFNKAFLSEIPLDYEEFSTDKHYTYILDRTIKRLIRIRRATSYILPSSPNVFNLSNMDFSNTHIPIWLVYDIETYDSYPALPFSREEIILVNITQNNPYLNCSFNKEGKYVFIFEGNSEYCSAMERSENKDATFCKLYLRTNVFISDEKTIEENLEIIFIVLAIVIFIFLTIFILLLLYEFKGCPVPKEKPMQNNSIISPITLIFRKINLLG